MLDSVIQLVEPHFLGFGFWFFAVMLCTTGTVPVDKKMMESLMEK